MEGTWAVLDRNWFCCPWISMAAWTETALTKLGWQCPRESVPMPVAQPQRGMTSQSLLSPSAPPQLADMPP